jgi:phospholipase C
MDRRGRQGGCSLLVLVALLVALGVPARAVAAPPPEGIHKIQHVIMIMQENRSFDSYFGTYPGVNGIPGGVCVPDPLHGGCVAPFHDPEDVNFGGPHAAKDALADINGGRMDGFVGQSEQGSGCNGKPDDPGCSPCSESNAAGCVDSMGYHDAREIPNYWSYAQNYVLQDNMFESNISWSLPEHLFLVSGWSAFCPLGDTNPLDCTRTLYPANPVKESVTYAWTDLTYLMHKAGVSWGYYVFEGNEPDCENDEAMTCEPVQQAPTTPGIWNPLVDFTDVKEDGQTENIQSLNEFYEGARQPGSCGLPSVSWVVPNNKVSEHPPSTVSAGQTYVTTLINAIMHSPCWQSSAIFLSWDDWGGFYDHVVPPAVDRNGFGLRLPGMVISPYAKAGYIDHQQLSHDAYLKFIEEDFLGGARLNPQTDGRPDKRTDVREEMPGVGNLVEDFNFDQTSSSPLILPAHPAPGPASCAPGSVAAGQLVPAPPACGAVAPAPPPSPPAPTPTPPAPPSVLPLTLQLTASVASRQDMRLHHGLVYLTVGCNDACSLFAHGHLSLKKHRHHLRLRSVSVKLVANRSSRISLALPRRTLAAMRAALRARHSVEALIALDVTGAGQARRSYLVRVQLSYR